MKIKQSSNTAWLVLFACATLALAHCAKRNNPGPEPISDEAAVMQAKDRLEIGYSGTDTAMSVTENVTLPTTGADGVVISWMSSDPSIISTDGTVTRPTDMDTDVHLTATLTKGDASDTKTFTLTAIIPDADPDTIAVRNAKNALAITYSGTDTAMNVTGNVTLPTTGADEVVISWMSSDTSIISTEGTVTRPTDMDTMVRLTATLSKNAAMGMRTFDLVVIITDAGADTIAVRDAKNALEIGYSGTDTAISVTENVTLPTAGANGVVISWMSSDPSIISTDGTVTRPTDMDTDVRLTATLTRGGASDTKTFTLAAIIPDADPDTIAVRNAKNALAITYSGTDTAMNVTGNVTLPTTGADEVVISWMSSNTSIISTEGTVTRPTDMDTMVRLTATLSKNAAMSMRTFDLVVSITDDAAVMQAKDSLAITYSGTDTALSVTGNVTLPTTGANGVVISWMSSDTGIISTAGVVTRPTDIDTEVHLTATLTRGDASDMKTFTLTAIIAGADADTIAVRNAKNALAITYSGTDTAMNVTGNVTLPTTGANGVVISWMSGDTSIVSTDGTVTRPTDTNTMVRLTATLSKNAAIGMRTFDLVVIITDKAAVIQAAASLSRRIGYSGTDTTLGVTENLTLPTTGANGVVISWMSGDTSIVSTDGTVTRPTDMNRLVRLTAILSKNENTPRVAFTVHIVVLATDEVVVMRATESLRIGYRGTDTAMNVTENLTLPTTGADGVVISWMSSDTDIINTDGTITRPTDMDTMVTLTATLSRGDAADQTKTFDLVVAVSITDEAAVRNAKDSLVIGYRGTDTAMSVTRNLTLPAIGADGVRIVWMSSDTGIISTNGRVTRPTDMNTDVTLTAGLFKGGSASDTKEFMLTVPTDNPKLIDIRSVAQLIAMRHDANGDGTVDDTENESSYKMAFPDLDTTVAWEGYELIADLDLSENNWTPQPSITATFEGNGSTISNMTVNQTTGSKWGFFREIDTRGHVRNLALRDVDVDGTNNTGSLAGVNRGTITGCSVTGTLDAAWWFNGGLVGFNDGGTITASYSEVTVAAKTNENGGLVGKNSGTITASYATGNVRTEGRSGGGLVGDNTGTITASYATGSLTASGTQTNKHMHGGLVGLNSGTGATIKASYATGNVSAGSQNDVGGLVGKNEGTITASYSTGTPTTTGSDRGGLVGDNDGTITASYFDSTTSGITTGDEAQTTSQLQTPTEYGTGTAIYSGWNIDVDNGFTRGVDDGSAAGDTTADDPWDFGTSSQYPVLKVDFNGDGTAGVAEFGSQR